MDSNQTKGVTKMEFVMLTCGNCGVTHQIPKAMYQTAYEEGGFWWCPNGHSRGFKQGRKTAEEKEREFHRLKQKEAQLTDEISSLNKKIEKIEKQRKAEHKRINNGVCPCCNRSFQNLKLHMKEKHPDFDGSKIIPMAKKV